ERERVALSPGLRREKIERHLVEVRLAAGHVARPAPLQHGPLAEMREVDVIERVVTEAREVGAGAESLEWRKGQPRIARIADGEARVALFPIDAGADLAPVAELLAGIETIVERVHPILGALVLSDEERQIAGFDRRVRHHEPAGELRQRQENLRG